MEFSCGAGVHLVGRGEFSAGTHLASRGRHRRRPLWGPGFACRQGALWPRATRAWSLPGTGARAAIAAITTGASPPRASRSAAPVTGATARLLRAGRERLSAPFSNCPNARARVGAEGVSEAGGLEGDATADEGAEAGARVRALWGLQGPAGSAPSPPGRSHGWAGRSREEAARRGRKRARARPPAPPPGRRCGRRAGVKAKGPRRFGAVRALRARKAPRLGTGPSRSAPHLEGASPPPSLLRGAGGPGGLARGQLDGARPPRPQPHALRDAFSRGARLEMERGGGRSRGRGEQGLVRVCFSPGEE